MHPDNPWLKMLPVHPGRCFADVGSGDNPQNWGPIAQCRCGLVLRIRSKLYADKLRIRHVVNEMACYCVARSVCMPPSKLTSRL